MPNPSTGNRVHVGSAYTHLRFALARAPDGREIVAVVGAGHPPIPGASADPLEGAVDLESVAHRMPAAQRLGALLVAPDVVAAEAADVTERGGVDRREEATDVEGRLVGSGVRRVGGAQM